MSCSTLRFAAISLVGSAFFAMPDRSHAKLVQVGDAIVNNAMNHFVVYYKSIPGVGNPGMRKHESFSYREVADELRRAKNNGWIIDFTRSYMEKRIILTGEEGDPASFNKRPIKRANPPPRGGGSPSGQVLAPPINMNGPGTIGRNDDGRQAQPQVRPKRGGETLFPDENASRSQPRNRPASGRPAKPDSRGLVQSNRPDNRPRGQRTINPRSSPSPRPSAIPSRNDSVSGSSNRPGSRGLVQSNRPDNRPRGQRTISPRSSPSPRPSAIPWCGVPGCTIHR